jgi:hypothetical protein
VVVILAFEAKRFPTDAFHCSHCIVIALNAIVAIGTRAALVGFARVSEKLANLFQVFVKCSGIAWIFGVV